MFSLQKLTQITRRISKIGLISLHYQPKKIIDGTHTVEFFYNLSHGHPLIFNPSLSLQLFQVLFSILQHGICFLVLGFSQQLPCFCYVLYCTPFGIIRVLTFMVLAHLSHLFCNITNYFVILQEYLNFSVTNYVFTLFEA